MYTSERLKELRTMCMQLEATPSRLDKQAIVAKHKAKDKQLARDIDYMFEILAGKHPIGFTTTFSIEKEAPALELCTQSLEEFLEPIFSIKNKQSDTLARLTYRYRGCGLYLNPILNREWRLGIGPSQLEVAETQPMLAKKLDLGKVPTTTKSEVDYLIKQGCIDAQGMYFITEKLDGNRCEARYDWSAKQWKFWSRCGKQLKVEFDMTGFDKNFIYDGEILSKAQLENPGQGNFNALSGTLNSKYGDKDQLVYMIFDINDPADIYIQRRACLESQQADRLINCTPFQLNRVRVLKLLAASTLEDLENVVSYWLNKIVSKGGEGIMVNCGWRRYERKRTDSLLKVKPVYSMDMRVTETIEGTGKNEGIVGSLFCEAYDSATGRKYRCNVGTGISDEQRKYWASDPSKIIGKIIEVEYFSAFQDEYSRSLGTKVFALRFPRLKRVRMDKEDTSVD